MDFIHELTKPRSTEHAVSWGWVVWWVSLNKTNRLLQRFSSYFGV